MKKALRLNAKYSSSLLVKGLIGVLFIIHMGACQEDLDLELTNTLEQKVVVEGRIRNVFEYQYLKLTLSDDYFGDEPIKAALAEDVMITNSDSTFIQYFRLSEPGYGIYISNQEFAGRIGDEYYLSFKYKGENYHAKTLLDTVALMDSIGYKYEYSNFFEEAGFYEINMSAYEPEPVGHHYIFNLYVNDTLYNNKLWLTAYAEDELLNGKNLVEMPIFSLPQEEIKQDTNIIRLEMLSISREEYNFIVAFNTETQSNGSMFSGPPADIPTNIINLSSQNNGLGFFSASAVASKETYLFKEHSDSTNSPDYEK